jgi:hypothetical protein
VTCNQERPQIPSISIDDMGPTQRQSYVAHLRDCDECRRRALAADPSLAFSLLPASEVTQDEIDGVLQGVRTLRRTQAIEAIADTRLSQGLVALGLAATLLIAVLLVPEFRRSADSTAVPFSGALGVGSGLVQVPQTRSVIANGTLRAELHRAADAGATRPATAAERLWVVEIPVESGSRVERQPRGAYRLAFEMIAVTESGGLELRDLQLHKLEGNNEVLLIAADVQPVRGRPLIVGSIPARGDDVASWLELTWLGGR